MTPKKIFCSVSGVNRNPSLDDSWPAAPPNGLFILEPVDSETWGVTRDGVYVEYKPYLVTDLGGGLFYYYSYFQIGWNGVPGQLFIGENSEPCAASYDNFWTQPTAMFYGGNAALISRE